MFRRVPLRLDPQDKGDMSYYFIPITEEEILELLPKPNAPRGDESKAIPLLSASLEQMGE